MKFEKKPMVNWYDPKQLAFTGVKTLLSSVFGNFADRREMQAALDQEAKPFDYSDKEEIWFDFISDLGDGFNPTYTLAKTLAEPSITVGGRELKRGDFLVMGGDEVYPTPEMIEYSNRLKGPYEAAFPKDDSPDAHRPDVYAIPGNHDWYDGLTNFLRLFTQERSLGNWKTRQTRSYFAIKLPHDYWLIAIDIQLHADIDYPQICYFRDIAQHHFTSQTKVILCTAEPSWVYRSFDQKSTAYDRFKFFIDKILYGKGNKAYEEKNQSITVNTILTGDLHHYARYEEKTVRGETRQLITAGGGGAFMHPTHTLKDTIAPVDGYSAQLKGVFPPREASVRLSLLNLLFPYFSLTMLTLFGIVHAFTSWILQTQQLASGDTLMEQLSKIPSFVEGFGTAFGAIVASLSHNPGAIFLNLLLLGGVVVFTDVKSGYGKWNYLAGAVHGLLHLMVFYGLLWLFSGINLDQLGLKVNQPSQVALFLAEMVVIGGTLSALIFGLYLTFSVLVLKNHITEASSSYRWEGYKNFLRLHLTKDCLTIYPIGFEKVVSDWKVSTEGDRAIVAGSPISFSLIEQPIEVHHEKTV
ncbi:metallophosphoesterase [Lunatimonas salinarum]|uniref:metallophosphoesterase n=1 Tax=Lunatimonas salinarum TaxID=1774590 RepID=UPI001FD8385D|nr:metallophosphoesterase [Lunatimonas salinarum]